MNRSRLMGNLNFFFSPFSSVDSIMILETFDKPKA